VKFIDRKASRPRENPVGRGPGPNWMEEMKKIQGGRGSGLVGVGRGGGGNKICQRGGGGSSIHFLRFKV